VVALPHFYAVFKHDKVAGGVPVLAREVLRIFQIVWKRGRQPIAFWREGITMQL